MSMPTAPTSKPLTPSLLALAAGAAVSFAVLTPQAMAQTWANNVAGGTPTWSTGANWLGGVPPVGSIDTALSFFYNFSSTAQTARNDLGAGTFNLNALTMTNDSAGNFTVSALAPANSLTFNTSSGSVGPVLANQSSRLATISAPLALNATTTILGAGIGNLTLSGIISSAGSGGLNFNMTGAGIVSLSGANTFTGNSVLNSGNLSLGNASALGAAGNTLTVNGGSVLFTSSVTVGQGIILNSDLNLTGFNSGTLTGAISGSGGVTARTTKSSSMAFTLQGNNTFAGAFDAKPVGMAAATTTLSGANGALSNTSAVTLTANQTLALNSSTAGTNNNNRLNDSAPIALRSAGLTLTGNSVGTSETVGTITFSGGAQLTVTPNAASSATLTTAALVRSNRGAMIFTGTGLGGSGANTSRIIATASPAGDLLGGGGAPGSTSISILPYAYAVNSAGASSNGQLVTYDNTVGVRPLTASEYAATLTGIRGTTSPTNVKVISAPAIKGVTTVNALVIDAGQSGTVPGGVYGSGSLIPSSGVVLFSYTGSLGGTTTIPSILSLGSLDFGVREGVIHAQNDAAITGTITGSNGLTKGGSGQLALAGANTFTGTVTVNSNANSPSGNAAISLASDSALGNSANTITLAGGSHTGISFDPSDMFGTSAVQSLTIPRNITLAQAGGGLQATLANTTLVASGVISGSGAFNSSLKSPAFTGGFVKLTGANTYTGATVISGNLAVNSDANLGLGTDIIAAGGCLRNDGPLVTSRNIFTSDAFNIFTNGFDATLNGAIQSHDTNVVAKFGPNTLTLTANSPIQAIFQIGQASASPIGDQDHLTRPGTVVLSGNGALVSATNMNVFAGALTLDNTATNVANRIGSNVSLNGGALNFLGNSSAPSTETFGTLTAGDTGPISGAGVVTIVPGSGQSAVLTSSNFARTNAAALLVRGTNLGGAIGPDTANFILNTVTLTNNIVPGIIGDVSASGQGSGFVTHAAGTGLRLLTPGEYSSNTFGAALNSDLTANQVLGGATSANAVRLGAGGGINATGQTLTVGSGMILATGGANSGIVGGTLAFGAVPATLWVNSDLAISSVITGSGGLNKAGSGNLTLNTASANTGKAIISNGRLIYGVANALPVATIVSLGTSGDVGAGTLDLNGTTSTVGGLAGFGTVDLNGGNLTTAGGSNLFAGSIVGAGTLTVSGDQTLLGVSSFSGNTTVIGGATLTLSANQPTVGNGPLGSGGTLILGNATTVGALSFGNNVGTMNKNIIVAANASGSFPQINSTILSNPILGGAITLNRTLRLGGSFGSGAPYTAITTLAGDISGAGGLDIVASSSFNLWGNNTFSGNVNLAGGQYLGLGTNTALGSGNVTVGAGGDTLRADNGARSVANNTYFTSSSAVTLGVVGVNDLTFTGPLDLGGGALAGSVAGARTFQVYNTGATTLAGAITGATASTLTKTGGGKLVMSGPNNTFAGNVTVSGGSLIVNGANNGAGSYTVGAGTLLGGSGSIAGSVSVLTGGLLEPGNSAGTLTTGALTLAPASFLMLELGDSTIPGASDLVKVNGNLSLAGGTGTITLNFEALPGFTLPLPATSWTIMTYTGTLTGGAANFVLGTLPAYVTSASIDTTSVPHSVILTLVPTPSSGALLALAGLIAAKRRKR